MLISMLAAAYDRDAGQVALASLPANSRSTRAGRCRLITLALLRARLIMRWRWRRQSATNADFDITAQ